MGIRQIISNIASHPLIKNSAIYVFTDAINKAIPFLLLPVLTYYLVPSDYGIATNFNVFTSILTIFIGLSIQGAISANFYKLNKRLLAVYISNAILIVTLAFVIIALLSYVFREYIFHFIPVPYVYILAGTVVAYAQSIAAINLTIWQLNSNPIKFGIYGITQTMVNVGLTLFLVVYLKLGWRGRIDAYVYSTVAYGLFSLFILLKYIGLKFTFKTRYFHDALLYSLPLVPHALSMWVRSGIDRVYITRFLGESATGIYATGFQFGLLVSFLTLSFNNAYIPYLYKNLSVSDKTALEGFKTKIVRYTYWYFFGLTLLGVGMIGLSLFLVDNFLSQRYHEARNFIPLIIVSQIFQGMYFMVGNYIFFIKKTKLLSLVTFSCSLLQVALSYLLIKRFGAMGAVYSTVIVSFVNFIAVWIYSNKVYPMPWLTFKKAL